MTMSVSVFCLLTVSASQVRSFSRCNFFSFPAGISTTKLLLIIKPTHPTSTPSPPDPTKMRSTYFNIAYNSIIES